MFCLQDGDLLKDDLRLPRRRGAAGSGALLPSTCRGHFLGRLCVAGMLREVAINDSGIVCHGNANTVNDSRVQRNISAVTDQWTQTPSNTAVACTAQFIVTLRAEKGSLHVDTSHAQH